MTNIELCASCLLGVESITGDELKRMHMENVRIENGRVLFSGSFEDIARANIRLRTAERVMILVGEFPAPSFDCLYDGVSALDWERYIPENGEFPVSGHCLNSALHAVPSCQSVIKKAIASRLLKKYNLQWLPEDGPLFRVRFTIIKDVISIYLDTSGTTLHKRGYRAVSGDAPLRETLAAAMVSLARFRGKEFFYDPFCGSGTIPIEAAMQALNRAPGLNRGFDAKNWPWLPSQVWESAAMEARDLEFTGHYHILGSDLDPKSLSVARENAKLAGVSDHIHFFEADATRLTPPSDRGIIVTNPPYGQRMLEKEQAEQLYRHFGAAAASLSDWKFYILSSHPEFEKAFGSPAVKKRKLYNGMLKCNLYMYY